MSIIDTLITDRTAADTAALETLFAKARAGSLTEEERAILANPAHKGAYNYTDLNRVNTAMEYLVTRLRGYGYAMAGYQRDETHWTMASIPNPARMQRYLDNVAAIRAALATLPGTPAAPGDMEALTAQEANAIEQILVNCEQVIGAMRNIVPHAAQPLVLCGFVIYAAQQGTYPAPTGLFVYTADGFAVYTSDGYAVQVKE
jgi:hypothetical protein